MFRSCLAERTDEFEGRLVSLDALRWGERQQVLEQIDVDVVIVARRVRWLLHGPIFSPSTPACAGRLAIRARRQEEPVKNPSTASKVLRGPATPVATFGLGLQMLARCGHRLAGHQPRLGAARHIGISFVY